MPGWKLITNHGLVLSYISKHPRSTARELAEAVNLTERSIRKIIDDLESAGFIVRRREGRRNRYRIKPHIVMSHPSHGEIAVGDLLEILGWRRRRLSIKAKGPQSPQLPGFSDLDLQTEPETTPEGITI
ncbi:MAG: winged helix-turn-helix domain-containing protein [Dehalococcoidia bacterium]|nr:winged helix-turn-helix domain-containing protein [Dehalococcoidia bacterium]